jgi:hypothetical protein
MRYGGDPASDGGTGGPAAAATHTRQARPTTRAAAGVGITTATGVWGIASAADRLFRGRGSDRNGRRGRTGEELQQ